MEKRERKMRRLGKLKRGKRQKVELRDGERDRQTHTVRVKEPKEEGGAQIISLPLIRLILKSLVASPLQASLTRLWLASLFRQRLKSTKGM